MVLVIFCIAVSCAKVQEEDSDVEYSTATKPQFGKKERAPLRWAAKAAKVVELDDEFSGESRSARHDDDDDDLGKIEEAVKQDAPKFKTVRRWDTQTNFLMEFGALGWISLAIVVYFLGKRTNETIAQKWLERMFELLYENFALVGDDGNFAAEPKAPHIMRQSNNQLTLFCSGRRHCKSALFVFNLRARQDLSASIINMFTGAPDELEVLFELENKDIGSPFTLAIVPTRTHKRYQKDHSDLSHIKSKGPGFKGLSDTFTVLTDSDTAASSLVNAQLVEALQQHKDAFVALHITDANPFPEARSKLVMSIRIALPSVTGNDNSPLSLVELAFSVLDRLSSIRGPDRVRRPVEAKKEEGTDSATSAAATKKKANLKQQHDEDLKHKAEERKRQEREQEQQRLEERLATLGPEERRKLEGKLARQEIKKKQKSSKNKVQFLSM